MNDSCIVVTNCTARKRALPEVPKTLSQLRCGSAKSVASAWVKALQRDTHLRPASDYYVGRGFSEARAVATWLNARSLIVSTGLGLIDSTDLIPNYDLTISPGQNSVLNLISNASDPMSEWWHHVNHAWGKDNPFCKVLTLNPKSLLLIALPSTYLALVQHELACLSSEHVKRIRIFTSELGRKNLPSQLAMQSLPYDERLEGSSISGTRTDFPQRALRHFVVTLNAATLPLSDGKWLVNQSLSHMKMRTIPMRRRQNDNEIIEIIRSNWHAYGGSSGALLRCLRDDKLIACEQSRFRSLWQHVRALVEQSKDAHD